NGPLDFFQNQSDPLSMKAGGFARGAGHGATFQDNQQKYWHVSTQVVAVKNNFERRLGIWPAGFDKDGVMYTNTIFGDYPHYLPGDTNNHLKSRFTGWMLLNYKKPVMVSSTYGNYAANNAVDESIKTYWSAATSNKGEWIQTDLGNVSTVNAVQINYADQDAIFLGKTTDQFHQYKLYYSIDGLKWNVLVDKSSNNTDVPHDYIELPKTVQARYIKMENIHIPSGKFAISGLRVFGNGNGAKPDAVKDFVVLRTEKDKRSAWLKWSPVDNAYAYNIYFGTDPEKLYTCIMVHDANDYYYKGMDLKKTYYYKIEAINENGVSVSSNIIKVD
ncbi:MAG: xylosidase, partial [Chitinophagia bacterium]|nr:xylosidase [Chitinophagia bacterium]